MWCLQTSSVDQITIKAGNAALSYSEFHYLLLLRKTVLWSSSWAQWDKKPFGKHLQFFLSWFFRVFSQPMMRKALLPFSSPDTGINHIHTLAHTYTRLHTRAQTYTLATRAHTVPGSVFLWWWNRLGRYFESSPSLNIYNLLLVKKKEKKLLKIQSLPKVLRSQAMRSTT